MRGGLVPSHPGPGVLAPTDPCSLHPRSLVTTLDPSAALLLPPHLLHGHKTMGLQAITSRGLARGHDEGAFCPSPLPTARGQGLCLQGIWSSPLTHHSPIPSSVNQWCEQLDSVWIWGKGELPWEGPAAKNGNVSPQKWGPGDTGPALPPLCSPIFVLLVCFFNLTSAAVHPPMPIFSPQVPAVLFLLSCPLWGWGGGVDVGSLSSAPTGGLGWTQCLPQLGAGPQHLSEQLELFSFQIVYSRLFILLFWNKIYFMAYDLWPPRGRRVVWEWRKTGGGWGSKKEAAGRVPNTWRGPHLGRPETHPCLGRDWQ